MDSKAVVRARAADSPGGRFAKNILRGVAIEVIVILALSIAACLVLLKLKDPMPAVAIACAAAAGIGVFAGSFAAARLNRSRGILCGMLCAAVLTVLLAAVSIFIRRDGGGYAPASLAVLAAAYICAVAGGVAGVNSKAPSGVKNKKISKYIKKRGK